MPNRYSNFFQSLKKEALGKLPLPAKALVWATENITGPAMQNIGQQWAEHTAPLARERFLNAIDGKTNYSHPTPIKNDLMKDVKIDWKKVGNFVLSMASNAQKNAMQSPTQQPYGYNAQTNANSGQFASLDNGTTPDAPSGKTSDSWDKNPLVLIGGLAILAMLLTKK